MANNKKHPKSVDPAEAVTRLQRVLMYVGGSVLGLGIASMFALIVGDFTARQAIEDNQGLWPVVAFMPLLAIPAGFLALMALIVITFRRRAQAAKVADK
ncbi:MAG TPA: hypothetical protein VHX87_06815 [Galbitalea sp.]|nr:hypothetical protein [Galbitalea sp.]